MERSEVTDEMVMKILEALTHSLGKKIEKHGRGAYVSRHECYGIIDEERHELMLALHANDETEFAQEAIDVATACIWSVASMLAGTSVNTTAPLVGVVKNEAATQFAPPEYTDVETAAETARRMMIERAKASNLIIATE